MSCGTHECGCGCDDLVQLEKPAKKTDALKTDQISLEGEEAETAIPPKAPA